MRLEGWVKLHRSLLDWEWYSDPNTRAVFLHLLLLANHKKNNWRGLTIERGQIVTSIKSLSSQLTMTEQAIRTSLRRLESTGEIFKKSTNKYTLITLIKYDTYQGEDEATNKQLTNKQQTNNNQLTTNKNEKNEKNEKKVRTQGAKGDEAKELAAGTQHVYLTKAEKYKLYEKAQEYYGQYDYKRYLKIATEKIDAHLSDTKKKYKSHYLMYLKWGLQAAKEVQLTDLRVSNAKKWEAR